MPRFVRIDATGPIKIEPAAFPRDAQGNLKNMFICACGLTKTPPFCDGTHKGTCPNEKPGMVYTYDPNTKQVISERPEE